MKLPIIRRIRREDLGGDAPAWVDKLLSPLNQFIEQVGNAVTGKLTFGENMAGKYITHEFTHNTALEVNIQDGRNVVGIIPVFADGNLITAYGFSKKDNGNIEITIQFSAGSGSADCKILILF